MSLAADNQIFFLSLHSFLWWRQHRWFQIEQTSFTVWHNDTAIHMRPFKEETHIIIQVEDEECAGQDVTRHPGGVIFGVSIPVCSCDDLNIHIEPRRCFCQKSFYIIFWYPVIFLIPFFLFLTPSSNSLPNSLETKYHSPLSVSRCEEGRCYRYLRIRGSLCAVLWRNWRQREAGVTVLKALTEAQTFSMKTDFLEEITPFSHLFSCLVGVPFAGWVEPARFWSLPFCYFHSEYQFSCVTIAIASLERFATHCKCLPKMFRCIFVYFLMNTVSMALLLL